MSAIASRRARRTTIALVSGLLVAVLVPVFGFVGANAILDSKGSASDVADSIPLPSTPTGLLATVDENDRLTSLTAFVLGHSGVGGSIVPLPVNTDSTGGVGDERVSFQAVYGAGGMAELVPAVESVLSVTFSFDAVHDAAGVGQLLLPLAPIALDLPSEVIDSDKGGSNKVVLAPGAHSLDARESGLVLTSDSRTIRQASRRAGIEAFWQGVVAAIGSGRSTDPPPTGAPTSFDELATRLFAGQTQTLPLVMTAVDPAINPTSADVEQVERTFAVFVFAAAAPGAMSSPAPGDRYRIEAPPGYEPEVQAVIAALLYLGDNIVSVNITAEPQPDTVAFVAPGSEPDEQVAEGLFGELDVRAVDTRIDGIDVTLVLGTDFLDEARIKPPAPASTTTMADAEQ